MEAVTGFARLLVVDDEATILELLSGSLRLAGFEVVTAASGAEAVRAAASDILGRGCSGLLVAKHEAGGIELLLGVSTDEVFGPVIVVGAGGVTAEAVRDVARAVLPLTEATVNRMLSSLRIAPLLDGWRGQPPVDQVDPRH